MSRAAKEMRIADDVLHVLGRSVVEANVARLPPEQAERKVYQRVNEVPSLREAVMLASVRTEGHGAAGSRLYCRHAARAPFSLQVHDSVPRR